METIFYHLRKTAILIMIMSLLFVVNTFAQRTASASGNWNNTATWGGNPVPTATDAVIIRDGVTLTVNVTNAACASMQINSGGNSTASLAFALSGSPSLTVTGKVTVGQLGNTNREGRITFTSGSTLECGSLSLGSVATQTSSLIMAAGGYLKVNGALTAFSGSTFTRGTGTVELTATNTLPSSIFTSFNNLIISGGTTTTGVALTAAASLTVKSASTFSVGHAVTASTVFLEGGCAVTGGIISGTGTLSLGGNITVTDNAGGTAGATISCPVALGGTRTITVADDGTAANDLTMSGVVSGTGFGVTKNGEGTLYLSGLNTYTGAVTIGAGTLLANTVANASSNSSLGTGGGTAAILIGVSGTLAYNGSGHSSSRAITLTGTGATIDASGSGALTLSGGIAGNTFNVVLTGTGIATQSGVIATTTGTLTKNGTGIWTLSGTNTYTGTTTVSAGTLVLNNTAALGATSNSFVVSSGAMADIVSNVTVGTLTLNGLGTSNGTWGFTGSGATFIDATSFTNSTTGKITVGTDSRVTPVVSPTIGTYTYSGTAQGPNTATNTGTGTSYTFSYAGMGVTTYTASSTRPTNAGSYTVTVTVAADRNYTSASSSATAFTITKATPTATLAVSNSPATYSGSAQSATVSISASSVSGTVTAISIGGSATQTNVGTYAVTASFVTTDSANYNMLTIVSSGNFVIIPAVLLITANNASKCVGATYNLGATAFTTSGMRSTDTIGSVSLTSSGSGSGASSGSYSIVPSAATGGTFSASNYSISYFEGILTVNPTNTAETASSTPNLCINTALTNINHTTTGATGIGTATGLPTGVAATFASNTLTISGTPTASGTFNYSIPLTGGCGNVNAIGTITVSPAPAGGTVAGSTTVCIGTNSVPLTLSGNVGTITRWESSLDNFATAGTSIANTTNTLTASNLTATTYYRAVVTSGVCASVNSTIVTITVNSCINKWKGSISTDWSNAGNWTLNQVPAVDANIVFDDSPANDCYLDQNRSVTNITNSQGVYGIVLNGNKLTLKGNLLFSGGASIDASASNSSMQFSGSVVQSISTGVFKNATVYNLDINNSNNIELSGNLRLLNNLTATTGLLDAFTNSPTVTYAGNTLQTIESNQFLGGKIDNLTIDNEIGVNLNTNFTITNTLVINIAKKLSVSSLYQLTALGTISNNGGASGLILKSNPIGTASLIHNMDNVPATVERYISGPTEGWHFLSSPVSNQVISGSWLPLGSYGTGNTATGTGFDLYVWDEPSFSFKYKLDTSPIGWNSVHSGPNFSAGRGYLYSVQETNPTKEFIGNLNNGPISYPITFTETLNPILFDLKGFNLVGNPYPSSLDWQASSGWDRTKLEVSGGGSDMWVWNPTANNYGVFNSASGVGTNSISRYLAPMQGYFVKAASNGNLVFDNSVRAHTGAGNWFKNSGINNPVIRITVESVAGNGADEALLQFGYSESNQGTSKLFSHVSSAPSLYLSLDDKKYSVRYLTNTTENNAVPMEFKPGKEGVYKLVFNFDSKEFDFIQLEDRLLKTATPIKPVGSYLFKSSMEDSVSRFVLHFTAAEITTIKELNGLVYMDGSQLTVDLKGINGQTEIKLFDISGKLILQKYLEGNGLTKLDLNLATQILLVRLTNEKGTSSTKVLFSPLKQ
jgi:autotransporter-associated beta strand protein